MIKGNNNRAEGVITCVSWSLEHHGMQGTSMSWLYKAVPINKKAKPSTGDKQCQSVTDEDDINYTVIDEDYDEIYKLQMKKMMKLPNNYVNLFSFEEVNKS